VKGSSTPNKPVVIKPNPQGVVIVGTDTAKEEIFYKLKNTEAGNGKIHFPMSVGENYFKQLTAESMKYKYRDGAKIRYWWKPDHARNEALDCMVYNYAAYRMLNPDIKKIIKNRSEEKKVTKKKKRHNFATGWK
jgi:phage terminase large subunit GpA-like protein